MKKLVALVSALCLGFVFTVGCGETGKATKKEDPKKPPVEKKTGEKTPEKTPEKGK
jgi:hypothetical protein